MSLASKMILIVVAAVSLILLSAFAYLAFSGRNDDLEYAYNSSEAIAKQNAAIIEAELESTLISARTLAQAISAFETFPIESRREICDDIICKIVEENENFLGAFACFEPNALDGLDSEYANTTGYDETGRYIPYCSRVDDTIALSPLTTYDTEGMNDYYTIAFNSGIEAVMEPCEYEIQGKNVLLTDFCIPIQNAEGKVVGVVGIDVSLDTLNNMDFYLGSYSSAQVDLLSNSGLYVIHSDSEVVGKPLSEIEPEADKIDAMQTAITEGTSYVAEGISEITGEKSLITMVPISIGNTVTPWSTGLSVAMSEISAQSNANMILLVILFFAVIGAIVIAIRFSVVKTIKKPLAELVEVAEQQAQGNYAIDINTDREDELGALYKSLKAVNNNMNALLTNLRNAADQVASGARQISDSSVMLSQGATEQASSIEELTASTEQISSQTNLNAENSAQANTLAENTKRYAESGNEQMNALLEAMEDINESSNNINRIIKVIDDIAFQTNILALNAAVEAARAGQHGKGFAVVAEEVRNLAARSASAAKETAEMIEASIRKADGGSKIASDTATALSSIVDEVGMLTELVHDIAVASNEQASGIAQVNAGIMQVSQVVQANSATSQQSAAASEELSGQAESLKEQISQFKLRTTVHESAEIVLPQHQDSIDDSVKY